MTALIQKTGQACTCGQGTEAETTRRGIVPQSNKSQVKKPKFIKSRTTELANTDLD